MTDPYAFAWPVSRIVEAIEVAARQSGLPMHQRVETAPTWGATELPGPAFEHWVSSCAGWLGVEAEPVEVDYFEVESVLLRAAPAIVRLPPDGPVLVIAGRRGRRIKLIAPDLATRFVAVTDLRSALCRAIVAPLRSATDAWLSSIVRDPIRRERVSDGIVAQSLQSRAVTRCYLLRIPAGASVWSQMKAEGLLRLMTLLVLASAGQYALGLLAWYTLGSGAFGGAIDRGWLIAWALVLITALPIQIVAVWLQGRALFGFGVLLKRRLLAGALRIDQDALRRDGAGRLLGRALDAGAVEALASSGGLFSALALVELLMVVAVLAAGPGGCCKLVRSSLGAC